jgi:hypothetical protein
MVELTMLIGFVWLIDRFTALPTGLHYMLWSLALIKAWVPPVFSIPIAQVDETAGPGMTMAVKYAASYTAVATGGGSVFPTPVLAFAAMWMFSIVPMPNGWC